MQTEQRTENGQHEIRTLMLRNYLRVLFRCALAGILLGTTAPGNSVAVQPVEESRGGWFWFGSSNEAEQETTNPFDRLPPASGGSSVQAPGIAQPAFVLPSTQSRSPSRSQVNDIPALSQPRWLQPQAVVIVSDDSEDDGATAAGSRATLTKTTGDGSNGPEPRKTSTAAKKDIAIRPGVAGLLQGLMGTNGVAHTPTNRQQEPESPAQKLVRQVAGVEVERAEANSPTSQTPATNGEAFPPAWMASGSEHAAKPATAVRQVSAAQNRIDATATTGDRTSSLWMQMGLVPETEVTQTSAISSANRGTSAPEVPQESIWTALLRPATLTDDAPPAPTLSESVKERSAAKQTRKKQRPESETVPDLLRPFYFVNEPAHRGATGTYQTTSSPPVTKPLESSLAKQLLLSTDEYLHAARDVDTLEEPLLADPAGAVNTFANQWSALSNPFLLSQQAPQLDMTLGASTNDDEAVQVSFLQEAQSNSRNGNLDLDDINLPGDDRDDVRGEGRDDKEKEGLVGAETLGEAPEDTTLDFLRTQTVLLAPGKMQFDIGFEYQLAENSFPILRLNEMGDIVAVEDVQFRGREMAVPMQIRYGVLNHVQAFLAVPVGWSNTQVSVDGIDIFDNDGGLGDIAFGAMVQLCSATQDRPYTIGSITAIAPTGGDPFTGIIGFSPQAPSLGNGFWSLGGNLLWVETRYDPVIVFYGLGYRYQFEHRYVGIEWQPGPEYNYTFGYGFAVNERVTLSTQFFGAYAEEFKANGDRLEGTNQEPMSVQLAATFIDRCDRIVEPFVTFGITDDAISSNVGITWTY